MSRYGLMLCWLLRAIGLLDMIALLAVFSPRDWMVRCHAWLGMGSFPAEPIAGYLARCASIWYVSYGLLLWFISCDVQKYSTLITCLATLMLLQGLIVMGIDVVEGMPGWWIAVEGPCCSGLGAGLLLMQRAASKARFGANGGNPLR